MTIAALDGWISVALIPLAGISGWILRRFGRGRFALRMRPHLLLGYAALVFALLHMMLSMGGVASSNTAGIWWASLAVTGLALQAFLGINLQSPGTYRRVLRGWHVVTLFATILLVAGHIALSAAFIPVSIP